MVWLPPLQKISSRSLMVTSELMCTGSSRPAVQWRRPAAAPGRSRTRTPSEGHHPVVVVVLRPPAARGRRSAVERGPRRGARVHVPAGRRQRDARRRSPARGPTRRRRRRRRRRPGSGCPRSRSRGSGPSAVTFIPCGSLTPCSPRRSGGPGRASRRVEELPHGGDEAAGRPARRRACCPGPSWRTARTAGSRCGRAPPASGVVEHRSCWLVLPRKPHVRDGLTLSAWPPASPSKY